MVNVQENAGITPPLNLLPFPVSASIGLSQNTKLFPLALLVCNAGAAVCYAAAGDYRRAVYWVASAICIAAITF